jgi:hypothetical protein
MTSREVRDLVEREIGDSWDRSNLHGIDLRTCLLEPRLTECLDPATGSRVALWIVLSEVPGSDSCYGVAFDEQSSEFGLVVFDPGAPPVLVGIHGGFLQAMEAM